MMRFANDLVSVSFEHVLTLPSGFMAQYGSMVPGHVTPKQVDLGPKAMAQDLRRLQTQTWSFYFYL
jgi:hypothetical protein